MQHARSVRDHVTLLFVNKHAPRVTRVWIILSKCCEFFNHYFMIYFFLFLGLHISSPSELDIVLSRVCFFFIELEGKST